MNADRLWCQLFGRRAPVEVEIGPGRGAFLFAAASAAPERDFFAIEHSASRVLRLTDEANRRSLQNVRILHGDAACVVKSVIPDATVTAYHVAFPDPWWKRRHHRRRLFNPEFAAGVARTLVPGGLVHVVSDVESYFWFMTELLSGVLEPDATVQPHRVITQFEQKACARGVTVRRASFRRPLSSQA